MPGQKLITKTEPQICLKVAWRAAQDLGYSLTPIDDSSKRFTATKGSLIGSMLGGMFAPQHIFQVTVETYPDSNELSVERNEPRLMSGAVGVAKVKRAAEDLMNTIAGAIEKAGGKVLDRKEY